MAGSRGEMDPASSLPAFHLNGPSEGDSGLYIMFNGEVLDAVFTLHAEGCWSLGVDTSRDLPEDATSARNTQFFAAGKRCRCRHARSRC